MESIDFKPFKCILCHMPFKTKQYLQRHMAVHSSIKEFECLFCKKAYKYRKGLNRHIKKNHIPGLVDITGISRKPFKVEDFLDLSKECRYRPKKSIDPLTGKVKEILFTWAPRKKID